MLNKIMINLSWPVNTSTKEKEKGRKRRNERRKRRKGKKRKREKKGKVGEILREGEEDKRENKMEGK